jgi:branched-chain amino acid transport system ATP-binding protein
MSDDTRSTVATGAADAGTTLAVEDLSVSYGKVQALRDVSFAVGAGELISVIGPNGAGKTTLADTIAGFLPYQGSVRYRDNEVRSRQVTANVEDGLIYCTETRDLFGFMSVEDNLTMGAYREYGQRAERLEYVYDLFPRLEERADQHAETLSGGEQQMLAIGRALMGDPELLILDEPTLGLAPVIVDDISDALTEIIDSGVTVLLCEQNVRFALTHADHIYLLENGEIVRDGPPESLRSDDYVQDAYLGN